MWLFFSTVMRHALGFQKAFSTVGVTIRVSTQRNVQIRLCTSVPTGYIVKKLVLHDPVRHIFLEEQQDTAECYGNSL